MKLSLLCVVVLALCSCSGNSSTGVKFKATATGHSATASWTASTTPGATYFLYGGIGSGNESSTAVNSTAISGTSYTDSTSSFLVSGNNVCYYVKSFLAGNPSGSQFSAASNESCGVVPSGPPAPPVQSPIQLVSLPPACLTSAPNQMVFLNTPLPTMAGQFQATYMEQLSVASADAVVGISSGPASAYGNLSAIVRANPATGYFDAFNSTAYQETNLVKFQVNAWYRITMVVNIASQTYSAYVNGTQIATNYGFRTKATNLSNVALVSEVGSETLCANTAV